MKKRIFILFLIIIMCIGFSACGSIESNYGNVGGTTIQFVEVPNTSLVYDANTKIVYMANYTYYGNYVYTAYIAENGLPYKYNTQTSSLEEIEE